MAIERALPSPVGPRAISIGAVASRVLNAGGPGHVAAVFERSCYVEFSGGLLCIGPRGLGNGPLNLLLDGPLPPLAREARATAAEGILTIGSAFVCDLRTARLWLPPIPDFDLRHLPRGRPCGVRASASTAVARRGSGPPAAFPCQAGTLACPLPPRVLPRSACRISSARRKAALPISPPASVPLLGLCPGLTPSGDDYLGGAMIALTLLRQTAKRDALWNSIAPLIGSHTTTISAAHLAAAAEGMGSEAVHHLLDDILVGGTPNLPRLSPPWRRSATRPDGTLSPAPIMVLRASLSAPDMARLRDASCGCAAGRFVKA